MNVLTKFGVIVMICLLAGLNGYSKTKRHAKKSTPKKTHITHHKVHTHPQPVAAVTPVHEVKKNDTIITVQLADASGASLANPTVNVKTQPASDLDKNHLYNRTVTRTVIPKKEETSFSESVLDWVKDKYSCMMEVLPNQISNVMLYRFIDDWYGVKYRMGGTSKKGVDCSAFVQTLYKYVFGLDLFRTACLQFNSSELIMNPSELQEGDLVFFKVNSSHISHVGVYLHNNFFVHSASSKGVSIANLNSAYWSKYFAGGGRILPKS